LIELNQLLAQLTHAYQSIASVEVEESLLLEAAESAEALVAMQQQGIESKRLKDVEKKRRQQEYFQKTSASSSSVSSRALKSKKDSAGKHRKHGRSGSTSKSKVSTRDGKDFHDVGANGRSERATAGASHLSAVGSIGAGEEKNGMEGGSFRGYNYSGDGGSGWHTDEFRHSGIRMNDKWETSSTSSSDSDSTSFSSRENDESSESSEGDADGCRGDDEDKDEAEAPEDATEMTPMNDRSDNDNSKPELSTSGNGVDDSEARFLPQPLPVPVNSSESNVPCMRVPALLVAVYSRLPKELRCHIERYDIPGDQLAVEGLERNIEQLRSSLMVKSAGSTFRSSGTRGIGWGASAPPDHGDNSGGCGRKCIKDESYGDGGNDDDDDDSDDIANTRAGGIKVIDPDEFQARLRREQLKRSLEKAQLKLQGRKPQSSHNQDVTYQSDPMSSTSSSSSAAAVSQLDEASSGFSCVREWGRNGGSGAANITPYDVRTHAKLEAILAQQRHTAGVNAAEAARFTLFSLRCEMLWASAAIMRVINALQPFAPASVPVPSPMKLIGTAPVPVPASRLSMVHFWAKELLQAIQRGLTIRTFKVNRIPLHFIVKAYLFFVVVCETLVTKYKQL
jgi:hypothetical protein